jgi:hypothetical protein
VVYDIESLIRVFFFFFLAVVHPCFVYHRCFFIHPSFLVRNKIRFTVARQSVGDMVIAGSTSAHQGWNSGRNLALAANFLDGFSIQIIIKDVMRGKVAPWPCACGLKSLPPAACAKGSFLGLPLHTYCNGQVGDVGSTIFQWIHNIIPYMYSDRDFLYEDPSRFARVWRYLHEFDLDGVM